MTDEQYAKLVDTDWPDCDVSLIYWDERTKDHRAMTNEEYEAWRERSNKEWEEAEFNQEPEDK